MGHVSNPRGIERPLLLQLSGKGLEMIAIAHDEFAAPPARFLCVEAQQSQAVYNRFRRAD